MTVSLEPQVSAAVGRADEGWLAAHLDGTSCPPAVLALLIRHEDPRLQLLGLGWLGERTAADRCADPAEAAALSRLLPGAVDGPPEFALALAELYQRLGRYLPERECFGDAAVPALTHAAGRARPDRRRIYTDVLALLGPA